MNVSTQLTRHYGAGPRHMYQFTYADPATVGPRQPLQLEFWLPKGRKGGRWVPQHLTHGLTGFSKAWRRVIPHHSHADKLAHSIGKVRAGYARNIEEQIKLFLALARARGLTHVHAFKGCKLAAKWAPSARLELIPVDPADFIGPAPEPDEPDAYGGWDTDGCPEPCEGVTV